MTLYNKFKSYSPEMKNAGSIFFYFLKLIFIYS